MSILRNSRLNFGNPQSTSGSIGLQLGEGSNLTDFSNDQAKTVAVPLGSIHPRSFVMPIKPGGLASLTQSVGSISSLQSLLVPARPMLASSTVQITVTSAQLDQIVSAVVNGTLSLAVASAVLAGAANADASGNITLTVNSALCGAIVSAIANASGVITPSVTMTAQGFMQAAAGGATPLSPEGLARSVWSELTATYNTVGTFGEQLKNLSGGGGGPSASAIADAVWDEAIAGHLTAGSTGAVLNQASAEIAQVKKNTDLIPGAL